MHVQKKTLRIVSKNQHITRTPATKKYFKSSYEGFVISFTMQSFFPLMYI